MKKQPNYRSLTQSEIAVLESQGCWSRDWSRLKVSVSFTPNHIRNTEFIGDNWLAADLSLFGTSIENCILEKQVSIRNVDILKNYHVGSAASIAQVGQIISSAKSNFGQGTLVNIVNESGTRAVPLHPKMSVNLAYLWTMYRHRPTLLKALDSMCNQPLSENNLGTIGQESKLYQCGEIVNVNIGEGSQIERITSLKEGTILSSIENPTILENGVIAKYFIMKEGSYLGNHTVVEHTLIGEATKVTDGFSAEHTMFFANSFMGRGEACAVLGGAFSVSHHKSTLMIANYLSFFNAGSGTNQSNHGYKLGPVHQGILERGVKTGSSSYLLWPARVGAFSLVIGKHYTPLDAQNLPFSYWIEDKGKTTIVPALNWQNIGMLRDSLKWAERDKRKGKKEDLIHTQVLSPYVGQKLMAGITELEQLKSDNPNAEIYSYQGVTIHSNALQRGIEIYTEILQIYLGQIILTKLEDTKVNSLTELIAELKPSSKIGTKKWSDIGGMYAPEEKIDAWISQIENLEISSITQALAALSEIYQTYSMDEWTWISAHLPKIFGFEWEYCSKENLIHLLETWTNAISNTEQKRKQDAAKEFSQTAQIGYGIDHPLEKNSDFEAVRGALNTHSSLIRMELESKKRGALIQQLKQKIASLN